MARLQRKKTTSSKKKKKRNAAKASAVQLSESTAANRKAASVSSARKLQKGQAPSQQKALAKARREPGKIKGYIDTSVQFLREVKIELKKVTWPPRKQTMGSTVVVIIMVMIISLFLGVVDLGLSSLIRVVLH